MNICEQDIQKLDAFIEGAKEIVITAHIHPDGDAAAAQRAVASAKPLKSIAFFREADFSGVFLSSISSHILLRVSVFNSSGAFILQ